MLGEFPRPRGYIIVVIRVTYVVAFLLALAAACMARPPLPAAIGQDVDHAAGDGDNLFTVAVKYGLAVEHLVFANDIRPLSIPVEPGTRILVPRRRILPDSPPRDGIVVNLAERGLYLFRGGRPAGFYPVAIGMPGRYATPRGTFSIVSRVENPTWLPPSWAEMAEERVGPGPANPLGDRWMGLSVGGVGIHSTNNPVWVGDAVTHACLRLYPAMAHELFERVRVGETVRIEYRTARLGRDPATGKILIATFPDIYGLADPVQSARHLVRSAGLRISDRRLREIASPPRGVALPL